MNAKKKNNIDYVSRPYIGCGKTNDKQPSYVILGDMLSLHYTTELTGGSCKELTGA